MLFSRNQVGLVLCEWYPCPEF